MPSTPPTFLAARPVRRIWLQIRSFFGFGGAETFFLTRWLLLRGIGAIFVVVFAGIIADHAALIGPRGVMPLAGFFTEHRAAYPHGIEAFLRAPSLFWLSPSPAMAATLAWSGLVAAAALTLNLWPRAALLACWTCLLSFVTTWRGFTATQVDQLMLEAALVCLPLAPAGLRPGLGAGSPPAPAAVFLVRWMLFRVMLENGLIKILAGDPHWLDLSALDVLYETSPFPTLLGYFDHQLPHAWHAIEAVLTFAAEIVAPLAVLVGGARWRWFAFITWTVFQLGIQLTNNFGWLNTASIGLGLVLLDDRMITAALARLRIAAPPAGRTISNVTPRWLAAAAAGHTVLTLYFAALGCGLPTTGLPWAAARQLQTILADFHSANFYTLFGRMLPGRVTVEFEGSNDGGRTWRLYEYRFQPQREDQISPFLAPRYARFEATLQVEANRTAPSPLFAHVAARLLAGSPEVIAQFRNDPFPDQPPGLIRLPVYQMRFTDFATWRATGRFWQKELTAFHQPMLYRDRQGAIIAAADAAEELRAQATQGNPDAQYLVGLVHARGEEVPRNLTEAAAWFRLAADQGVAAAQGRLGSLLLSGEGVARDPAEAARRFRQAAEQGNAYAAANLALLHARGEGVPRDEAEALVWFDVAAALGDGDAARNREIAIRRVGADGTAAAAARAEKILAAIRARAPQS